jgi:hypothetical protein
MPREVKILTAGLEETFLPFKKARVWLWGCVSALIELIQNGTHKRKSESPSVNLFGRKKSTSGFRTTDLSRINTTENPLDRLGRLVLKNVYLKTIL